MRVLGLDIGNYSVKAVEMDSSFGRFVIHDYHELRTDQSQDGFQTAIKLIASLSKKPDRIAIALPPEQATFRNLNLPTRDRKAIQAAVAFELEDELPFDLDKGEYAYNIISHGKMGAHIHVATTLKKYISELLARTEAAGINPDLITTNTWAYRMLLQKILGENPPKEPVMFIHMGSRNTTIYVHWQENAILSKEIMIGGNDISTAISQKYGISLQDAEKAKNDNGFILTHSQEPQATRDQIEFSNTIYHALKDVLQEIRQTMLNIKGMTQSPLGRIYISGGSALLPGLRPVVHELTGAPVYALQALSMINPSGVAYSENTDAGFALAAALALCMVGTDRSGGINFRKGEFSKSGPVAATINTSTLKAPVKALSLIAIVMLISLGIQSVVYDSESREINKRLEKSMSMFFTSLSKSAAKSYLSNTIQLKKAINEELKKAQETAKLSEPNPNFPIDFLKNLSQVIPQNIIIDMTKFDIGSVPADPYQPNSSQNAELTFQVQQTSNIDMIQKYLGNVLNNLQASKPEQVTSADGKGLKWTVKFTGTPKERSHADEN